MVTQQVEFFQFVWLKFIRFSFASIFVCFSFTLSFVLLSLMPSLFWCSASILILISKCVCKIHFQHKSKWKAVKAFSVKFDWAHFERCVALHQQANELCRSLIHYWRCPFMKNECHANESKSALKQTSSVPFIIIDVVAVAALLTVRSSWPKNDWQFQSLINYELWSTAKAQVPTRVSVLVVT